ncbi:hypothetical protein F4780DRAFT_773345 [Xylariomycetidae sp. FL0641]|nr:hypothetical protein F4780DRAFT_773345 [Xylariomycetidae sp. FL0641]
MTATHPYTPRSSLNSRPSSHLSATSASDSKSGLKRLPSSDSLDRRAQRPPTITVARPVAKNTANRNNNNTTTSKSTTSTTTNPKPRLAGASTTSSASSTSDKPASAVSRAPLKRRDQNVTPVTNPPKSPGIMPSDVSSTSNPNRPQMPSLTASAARGTNRAPLTPKIASKPSQPNPALATTTPSNRRPRPLSGVSSRDALTLRASHHDDPHSPALAPHLSANITPRSGSRQSRVDSTNTTPNGTPNPERSDKRASFGPTSPRLADSDVPRRPVVAFAPASSNSHLHARPDAQTAPESKFFHASDAPKNPRPTSVQKPPPAPKGPTFFYANGNDAETHQPNPTAHTPVPAGAHGHAHEDRSSKFLYANGTPEGREFRKSSPATLSRTSGSTVSTASKQANRPVSSSPAIGSTLSQRPSSPNKGHSQQHVPTRNGHNLPPTSRPRLTSPPPIRPSAQGLRRSSAGTSRSGPHSRSGSVVSGDHGSDVSRGLGSPVSELAPPINISSKPAPLTLASIIQAADDFAENEEVASPGDAPSGLQSPAGPQSPSGVQSPTKSSQSAEPVSDLVANARRERKVQDLQITNASLEAINRTLERQLRKQSAEIRRFRRLSRAGRLSSVSAGMASHGPSETEENASGLVLSELSEGESGMEEMEDIEEESLSDTDSITSSQSPSVVAEKDAKHRKRDEHRLEQDLSKHQQLLTDSQKINQSIKRCLDWTEELIKDGKKALEYKVRVSDVKLGGRILNPLDEDDDRSGAPSPFPDDASTAEGKTAEDPTRLGTWGIDPQDRDSGIELPAEGS